MMPFLPSKSDTTSRRVAGALLAVAILASATTAFALQSRGGRGVANRVTLGAGGSHIMGNVAAPVKLAEYVSYTCSHCADFARDAGPVLRGHVARGAMSVEVRHIVRDPVDMAAAVLANCGPTAGFFARHEALMAEQPRILARVGALNQAQIQRWGDGTPAQRLRTVALDSGIAAFMRTQRLSQEQIDRCLADTTIQNRLLDMTNAGSQLGVTGTPSFTINGRLIENTHNWATLQPVLAVLLRPAPTRR